MKPYDPKTAKPGDIMLTIGSTGTRHFVSLLTENGGYRPLKTWDDDSWRVHRDGRLQQPGGNRRFILEDGDEYYDQACTTVMAWRLNGEK